MRQLADVISEGFFKNTGNDNIRFRHMKDQLMVLNKKSDWSKQDQNTVREILGEFMKNAMTDGSMLSYCKFGEKLDWRTNIVRNSQDGWHIFSHYTIKPYTCRLNYAIERIVTDADMTELVIQTLEYHPSNPEKINEGFFKNVGGGNLITHFQEDLKKAEDAAAEMNGWNEEVFVAVLDAFEFLLKNMKVGQKIRYSYDQGESHVYIEKKGSDAFTTEVVATKTGKSLSVYGRCSLRHLCDILFSDYQENWITGVEYSFELV